MANKNLFTSSVGSYVRPTDTMNLAGGSAYSLSAKQALAQYVMTGCLNGTFYATAEKQLVDILSLCKEVEASFVAKLAVLAREKGYMKDTPALLLAHLSAGIGKEYLPSIFLRVIDNGKMLRNYVQIMRSGTVGRKSLGSLPRRMVREYLQQRGVARLLKDSIGNDPSLADIVKIVHPNPETMKKGAFYRYLLGKEVNEGEHDQSVQELLKFRRGDDADISQIDFRLLTEKELTKEQWVTLLPNMGWHALRININALNRAGVLADRSVQELVANRLSDKEAIRKARVFPYQLFAAYVSTTDVPSLIREALQDAMETATENVPSFGNCAVVICQDVSGSMNSPITGSRGSASSKVSCCQVGALITSCLIRTNKRAKVLPFDTSIHSVQINPRDSVMTNAQKLSIHGGGTDCAVPMGFLAAANGKIPDKLVVVYVSDNESWAHDHPTWMSRHSTMQYWEVLRSKCKEAKLVCIDLTPNKTSQVYNTKDVLNIGGFSDQVFTVMEQFVKGESTADFWVDEIEKVVL